MSRMYFSLGRGTAHLSTNIPRQKERSFSLDPSYRILSVSKAIRSYSAFSSRHDTLRIVRQADVHHITKDAHSAVSNFIDGLARQHSVDISTEMESDANEYVHRSMYSITCEPYASQLKPPSTYFCMRDGPPLPTSFHSACLHPKWSEAIYREYSALFRRKS